MEIDVIIPLYRPGREFFDLIDLLEHQTMPVHRIILMNTEEKYFQTLTAGTDFEHTHPNVEIYHLTKWEFDHGRTRRDGVARSKAPIFVMMTQDAMPQDDRLIEKLVADLKDDVAVVYARQLAGKGSGILERVSRRFNYPDRSRIKSAEDLERLGIKTFFCSNVCAAYRRDIYEKLGGFVDRAIFNEDMVYAAGAIRAGYRIAYEAQARVIHSHNYSCMQQFHRNFDLGVSQADHPEVFGGIRSESEGMRMVKTATAYLRKKRLFYQIPYFYLQCGFKYAGYLLGKHYKSLPRRVILACTASPDYWRQ